MAIRYAIKDGLWSDPTVWNGGTLPTPADTVYANGFNVMIDMTTVTVVGIANAAVASPVIAVGGVFNIVGSCTLTLTGDITPSLQRATGSGILLNVTGGATVVINAKNVTGAPTATLAPSNVFNVSTFFSGNLTINIDGHATWGATYYCGVLTIEPISTPRVVNVNISGDLVGGSTFSTFATINAQASGTTLNLAVAGNLRGTGVVLSQVNGTTNLTFTDCVFSGTTALIHSRGGTLNVIGGIFRGSSSNTLVGALDPQQSQTATTTLRDCTFYPGSAPNGAPAVAGSTAGRTAKLRISGDIYHGGVVANTGPWGFPAITTQYIVDDGGSGLRIHTLNDVAWPSMAGEETILSADGDFGELPVPADVRVDTAYGPSGAYTGTLAVPPVLSVAAGVPVGDTVGTGGVSLADIASVTGAQITAAIDS